MLFAWYGQVLTAYLLFVLRVACTHSIVWARLTCLTVVFLTFSVLAQRVRVCICVCGALWHSFKSKSHGLLAAYVLMDSASPPGSARQQGPQHHEAMGCSVVGDRNWPRSLCMTGIDCLGARTHGLTHAYPSTSGFRHRERAGDSMELAPSCKTPSPLNNFGNSLREE